MVETAAKPQHPVAYLEQLMEQNLPFDLDALLVFGKVVESRSLSKAFCEGLVHCSECPSRRSVAS
jgi:hypothetical protein